MRIIGVDFSGAKNESKSKTWLARGELKGDVLALKCCQSVKRAKLTCELSALSEPTVVAMDFPFSLPVQFVQHWRPDIVVAGKQMPDLWEAAAQMEWDSFKCLKSQLGLVEFVRWHGEPKRDSDPPESFSPLHIYRPNMLPMTFRGMKMLHSLWVDAKAKNKPLWVPPLPKPVTGQCVTLLEVMPGAVLRSLGLPFRKYKGKAEAAAKMRGDILTKLQSEVVPAVQVEDLSHLRDKCKSNDDALDAVVAAIAAALWHIDKNRFPKPPEKCQPDYDRVQLEGWLYTPRGCCPQCGSIPPVQEW